jgi:hypothetical protein
VVLHGKATIAACPNKNRPILRRPDDDFPASGSTMCKNMAARKKAEALSALILIRTDKASVRRLNVF